MMHTLAQDPCHALKLHRPPPPPPPPFSHRAQTKPVHVYKLVTKDTVDAKILELGKGKTVVNAALLDGDDGGGGGGKGKGSDALSMSAMLKDALKSFLG